MKRIFTFALALLLSSLAMGQIDKMKDILDDELMMLEDGKLKIRFFDAVSGQPVRDANLSFEHGLQAQSGMDGSVTVTLPQKDGVYPFECTKEGYIQAVFELEVIGGTVFNNRFHLSPVIDLGTIRIVLEWGKRPDDLDLHLVKTNGYHISYRNMKSSGDGTASLDRDALNGFGPETITITNLDDKAEYRCYVHDFSNRDKANSRTLSRSKATVTVYAEGKQWGTFQIDEVQKGNSWEVFRILNSEIIPEGKLKVRR